MPAAAGSRPAASAASRKTNAGAGSAASARRAKAPARNDNSAARLTGGLLNRALRGGDVHDGQGTGVPRLGAARDVPVDVELVARRIDCGAEGALQRAAELLPIVVGQKRDHLPALRPRVELHDGAIIELAPAVRARDVIDVAARRVGIDGGDVSLRAHRGRAERLDR